MSEVTLNERSNEHTSLVNAIVHFITAQGTARQDYNISVLCPLTDIRFALTGLEEHGDHQL